MEMVQAASINGSAGEQAFPDILMGLLRRHPYFTAHPENVWAQTIENDPLKRRNVYALVRGQGAATVVLTGHFDVVDTGNYGPHADVAFDPAALLPRLIEDLEVNARSTAELRALADLKSGHFLPGRGALDMKAGLAAGISVLERFAELPEAERVGNVLFVAVADEEVSSHGARWAAPHLPELARERELTISGVINLDATGDNGDGTAGQAVYTGTAGKLLVSAFVVGVDTHAGYALDGVNVNFLASQLVSRFEANPYLTDTSGGIMGTPPTLLKQTDLKTHYDVTTPARAWLYVNTLSHGQKAGEVLERFKEVAQEALLDGLNTLKVRAEALHNFHSAAHGATPLVLTYAELLEVAHNNNPQLDELLAAFIGGLSEELDYPTRSAQINSWLWDISGLLGPAVVLGFASLHYPNAVLDTHYPEDAAFLQTVRETLQQSAQRRGVTVTERPVFTGISDMSWFGRSDPSDIATVNANTPVPQAQIHALPAGLPSINLGPWGRDYHQWLERVYKPYSFEVLPELIWDLCHALIQKEANQ